MMMHHDRVTFDRVNHCVPQSVSATQPPATTAATPFRRFSDIAFDEFGYFSYGSTVTTGTFGNPATIDPIPPLYAGSLFVADMSQGLSVDVDGVGVFVPVNGPGGASITYNTATDPVTVLNLGVTDAFALVVD